MASIKIWAVVKELDNGKLIVEGEDGTVWAAYDRTKPADESKAENWGHELRTDVAGMVRAALGRMLKEQGYEVAKFERRT